MTTNASTDAVSDHTNLSMLRIASLLPSATEICDRLGLAESVVGITHECDVLFTDTTTGNYASIEEALLKNGIHIVTTSEIDPHALDQGTIDRKVKESISQNISLYTIHQQIFDQINPNVIITQQLCDVCAPSMNHLQETIAAASKRNQESSTTTTNTNNNNNNNMVIVSLEPTNLLQVAETFVTVAKACDVAERGFQLKREFLENLNLLNSTIQEAIRNSAGPLTTTEKNSPTKPKVLILEWLDPPFDAGHWVPEMVAYAGCCSALNETNDEPVTTQNDAQLNNSNNQLHDNDEDDDDVALPKRSYYNHKKSKQITWDDIYKSDPDCILIACCGFNTDRNVTDASKMQHPLSKLRAYKENRIYACDGNRYFARPGPSLVQGCYIVARVAFDTDTIVGANVIRSIDEDSCLPFQIPTKGVAWKRVEFNSSNEEPTNNKSFDAAVTLSEEQLSNHSTIPDIESLVLADGLQQSDFYTLHNKACEAQQTYYIDPQTGFRVFTEYALKQRGKCCGSGCRHCPYNHLNVIDKASKIQQPAFLHEEWATDKEGSTLFSLSKSTDDNKQIKVLFFSGGKDSYLALRALARDCLNNKQAPFSLILLTTFDASSRIIAHQDIPIDVVVRQAKHLKISLVGVPLHRTTSETYEHRIQRALNMIKDRVGKKPFSLVFGDLHLDHIRQWRDVSLGLDWRLEYPMWQVPYEVLLTEIEACGVVFVISATERDDVKLGTVFTREFSNWISTSTEIDGMGENGEFHTVAQVWTVKRERALGITGAE